MVEPITHAMTGIDYTGLAGSSDASTRDMLRMGNDIAGRDSRRRVRARERRGECTTCGQPLFKKAGILGYKKLMINNDLAYNGRCLKCNPLPTGGLPPSQAFAAAGAAPPAVNVTAGYDWDGEEIVGRDGSRLPRVLQCNRRLDDETVISTITMEKGLLQCGDDGYDDDDDGDEDDDPNPHQMRRIMLAGVVEDPENNETRPTVSLEHREVGSPPWARTRLNQEGMSNQEGMFGATRQGTICWVPPTVPEVGETSTSEEKAEIESPLYSHPRSSYCNSKSNSDSGSLGELIEDMDPKLLVQDHLPGPPPFQNCNDRSFRELFKGRSRSSRDINSNSNLNGSNSQSFREIYVDPGSLTPDDNVDAAASSPAAQHKPQVTFEPKSPPMFSTSKKKKAESPMKPKVDSPLRNQGGTDDEEKKCTDSTTSSNNISAIESPVFVARAGGTVISESSSATMDIKDIPQSIATLRRKGIPGNKAAACMDQLASIIWTNGSPARAEFASEQHKGVEMLTSKLYESTTSKDAALQEAALGLLFALVASETGEAEQDVICGGVGEACVDALLISLQMWIASAPIQELGCRILACLASASSNNSAVSDGAPEAIETVVRAMSTHHGSSLSVQEWGVRALYNQCVLSAQAEANKRTLLASPLDCCAVLLRSMQCIASSSPSEPLLLERFCRLYWCLSSAPASSSSRETSNGCCSSLSSSAESVIRVIVSALRRFYTTTESLSLCEASLGAIANLLLLSTKRRSGGGRDVDKDEDFDIIAEDVFSVALEILQMRCNESSRVVAEACCALANTARALPGDKIDSLIEPAAIATILQTVISLKGEDWDLLDSQEEAMRVLVVLTDCSSVARNALLDRSLYSKLMKLGREQEQSLAFQTSFCRLLSSLMLHPTITRGAVFSEMLEAICRAMAIHVDSEALQASACTIFRVISGCKEDRVTALINSDARIRSMAAMKHHPDSESIQYDACYVIWRSWSISHAFSDAEQSIRLIVEALKTHLESARIAEVACNTLWSLIHGSDELKQTLVQTEGAVEAIFCVLVMYPDNAAFIEKAVGLLACLSSSPSLVKDLATTERTEAVVEAMRNNRNHAGILEFSILFLRNAISVAPEVADDANRSLSVVIAAMKDGLGGTDFQRQACNLLWVVSASSDCSKSMILTLDGISVLMETLEKFSMFPDVQVAALGAFNELALDAGS